MTADDEFLGRALAEEGLAWEAAPWNGAHIDWARFNAVIIRSTWDYHHDLNGFLAWIARIEKLGVRLFNPPDIIRWNSRKTYLRSLAEQGVAVTPTVWIDQGAALDLASVMDERGWRQAVIKPTVSAAAYGLIKVDRDALEANATVIADALSKFSLMVQPYLPQIERGEVSQIFIDGRLSHAVLKRPAKGDFRVQSAYGGTVARIELADRWVRGCASIVELAGRPAYARVDGVIDCDQFTLMELELIEPELFFRFRPEAARDLATAIARRLREA